MAARQSNVNRCVRHTIHRGITSPVSGSIAWNFASVTF
jgi:hypothetical protein